MAQSNGYISAGYGDDAEDKPMLVMKSGKSGSDNGGHGITALINRQLQGKAAEGSVRTKNIIIIAQQAVMALLFLFVLAVSPRNVNVLVF